MTATASLSRPPRRKAASGVPTPRGGKAARKPASSAAPAAAPQGGSGPAPIDTKEPAANTRPTIDPTKYLDFVRRIATRMARNLPSHVSLDDLIGAGTLGLIDAMDRYDPQKAERFETFAEFRIKGAILDELRRYDLMARNARLTAKRLARKTQELTARLGRPPSESGGAPTINTSAGNNRKRIDRVGTVRVLSRGDLPGPGDRSGGRHFHLALNAP